MSTPSGPAEGHTTSHGTPDADVDVPPGVVRALLEDQHADLANLPLTVAASGWDNITYRLGEELAVRLPRRSVAAGLTLTEQRWLGSLAPLLPLPIPAPLRTGVPGRGYPWAWSIVPWFTGTPAAEEPPHTDEAAALGAFLGALHRPSPSAAPVNPYRGVALAERVDALDLRLDRLPPGSGVDTRAVRAVVAAGVAAPQAAVARWLHGDLHPRNVLTVRGRIAAIVDWGDLAGGDAATDLAGLWMLFDEPAHHAFWETYGRTEPGLAERARGWAAVFGVILLSVGLADGDPGFTDVGRRTLRRLDAAAT